jgi:hypothetical protein
MNSTFTPTKFYDRLKKFFENGHLAFANGRKPKAVEEAKDQKIQQLQAKLTRKNEVVAENPPLQAEPLQITLVGFAESPCATPDAGRGIRRCAVP